jgi:hypothetical protein
MLHRAPRWRHAVTIANMHKPVIFAMPDPHHLGRVMIAELPVDFPEQFDLFHVVRFPSVCLLIAPGNARVLPRASSWDQTSSPASS